MAGSRTLKLELLAVDKGFGRAFGRAESKVQRFGRTAGRAFGALALGAGAAFGAVALGAKSVTEDASDLQQAMGAVDSVFGDARTAIDRFADTSAQAAGLAKQEVLQMASTMGAQLQGFGFEADAAADTTVELQQRAADMAATFGGPVSDAVGAIGSLMRGEADPIERFGVSIKQADVNARLAAQGMGDLEGEERKLAETQARLDLLMEQTASSAGQFARESDTLAGKQERLRAQVADTRAELGEKLLPLFEKGTDLAATFAEWLGPKLERAAELLAEKLEDLGAWWEANGPAIRDRLREIGETVQRWWEETARPAIQRVRDALAEFWENTAKPILEELRAAWDRNKTGIQEAAESIGAAIGSIAGAFGNVFGGAISDASSDTEGMGDTLDTLVAALVAAAEVIETVAGWLETLTGWANSAGGALDGLLNPLRGIADRWDNLRSSVTANRNAGGLDGFVSRALGVLPGLASGGIVTAPTLAVVGEGTEPEAVLPLSRLDAMLDGRGPGRGPGHVTINVTGTMLDPEGVARAVQQALDRSVARAGAY